jgi:hypothetical protein
MPWFTVPHDLEYRATKPVKRALALFPEVDGWFTDRSLGPHILRVGYPIRPRNRQ